MATESLYADLAGAILDGKPIDWAAAESSAGEAERPLLERLKVLAALADLHRSLGHAVAGTTSAPAAGAATERWGHLLVLERIGSGANGSVYRAWDERLDREVALKLLPVRPNEAAGRGATIIEEGRALARVRHPNVVTLYGAEVIDDRVGLWMELVRGRTLEQLVREGKRWSAAEAVAIGVELCRAVSAVHQAGLIHRDIKASNVGVAEDGRIVLMDFGTGSALQSPSSVGSVIADSPAAPLAGTPLYLAPELFAGGDPSASSDVYSLGVLLYRLVTGSYPVRAPDLAGLRLAHQRGARTDTATARPDLETSLARIIDRAIAADPTRRYATADALAADLTALSRRASLGARALRLGVAAGLAALAIAAGWQMRGGQGGADADSSFGAPPASAPPQSSTRALAPTLEPAIAVLPFDDLGDGPASASFADGLTDEILRDLAGVDGLTVRSRYSSFRFRGEQRDLRAIADRLGVSHAVTGSVARSGSRLRVQAQLFELEHDVPLWAERFDREVESAADVLAIVDDIARAIVNELRLTLGRGQRRYYLDLETYEKYLEARSLAEQQGLDGPRRAAELFEQIIASDAAFAPAHAGLTDAVAFLSMIAYQSGLTPGQALAIMRREAVEALALDPMLAEAHAAMGVVQARERAWSESQRSFERAIELDPTLTGVYIRYSLWTLRPLEQYEKAERLLQAALENDPLSVDLQRELGELEVTAGRYDDAIARLERIRSDDLPFVDQFLARAMTFSGRAPEAVELFEAAAARGRGVPHYLAHAYVRAGRRADAERLVEQNRGFAQRELGIYTALGDLDRAFAALDRAAVEEPQRLPLLLTYPEMAVLRGDPRLAAFRRRFGLP